jgi:hypothetical protein
MFGAMYCGIWLTCGSLEVDCGVATPVVAWGEGATMDSCLWLWLWFSGVGTLLVLSGTGCPMVLDLTISSAVGFVLASWGYGG